MTASAAWAVATADPARAALAAHVAKSGEAVKSGPIGLGVILLLCVACYFLFKSMSKHLRTVREDFPQDDAAKTQQLSIETSSETSPAEAVDLRKSPGQTGTSKPGAPPEPPAHP